MRGNCLGVLQIAPWTFMRNVSAALATFFRLQVPKVGKGGGSSRL
jgi:hypothetical protein